MLSGSPAAADITVGSGTEHFAQLVELSEKVYGFHPDMSSEAYHRWLNIDGPLGPAIQASAFAGGRMIGHYAVVPLPFHDAEGEFRAGLGVNALVRPDAEGRGLFARLVSAADRAAAAAGIELLYVVPGPQSEPWFTSILRYVRDGELSIFVSPLRLGSLLRHGPSKLRPFAGLGVVVDPLLRLRSGLVNRVRASSALRIEPVTRFGTEFDDLWRRMQSAAGRTTARTSAFLNWRYLACPTRPYRSMVAWSGSRIVAYVVSRSRTVQHVPGIRLGSIVDLVSDGTSEGDAAATALTAEACRILRDGGSDAIIAQLRLPSRLSRSLRRNGLWRIPGKHLAYRPIAFKGRGAVSHAPYHFAGGDFDMG